MGFYIRFLDLLHSYASPESCYQTRSYNGGLTSIFSLSLLVFTLIYYLTVWQMMLRGWHLILANRPDRGLDPGCDWWYCVRLSVLLVRIVEWWGRVWRMVRALHHAVASYSIYPAILSSVVSSPLTISFRIVGLYGIEVKLLETKFSRIPFDFRNKRGIFQS